MSVIRCLPETRLFGLKRALLSAAGVKVGRGVRFCSSALILGGGTLSIGDDTWIGHQVLIVAASDVFIGNRVDLAPRVYIGTGTHAPDVDGLRAAGQELTRDIHIGDGAWLGACSCILPGVRIGTNAVVAAGAVVTKDVAEKTVVGGVPAVCLRGSGSLRASSPAE
ncbi:MAG TPA: acyltransferase [Opitutales bacterium]|nr:acyltransferase [Opitutales bacterium]